MSRVIKLGIPSLSSITLKLSVFFRWVMVPITDFIETKLPVSWDNYLSKINVLFVTLHSVIISIFLRILISLEHTVFNT